MVPPSRLVRADDQMSLQETQKSRSSVPHFSANESAPPDVRGASVELASASQPVPTRRITSKRHAHPLDLAEQKEKTRKS